jgi:hypothetical protein
VSIPILPPHLARLQGVKHVRGEAMDKLVDDLLKEMKESKTP